MSFSIIRACFFLLLSIVHYALKKCFKLFHTHSRCMMVVKHWLVLNFGVECCHWFLKFLNTILKRSGIAHVVWIIIYNHLFCVFFKIAIAPLSIIHSLILWYLLRRLDKSLALGELPEFHNHKKSTKLLTNKQKTSK